MTSEPSTRAEWPDARVVVVDDEEPIRRVLAEMLRAHGYTDVHAVADAKALLDRYDELAPDLLVLDLHMPGMDGAEVLERLGGRPEEEHPPVIVMTGAEQRGDARRTLALGAADFLTKPIDAIELLLRVRHQLRDRRLRTELALHSEHLEGLVEQRAGELTLLSHVLDDMPLPALVLTGSLTLHYANARGDQLLEAAGGRIIAALACDDEQRDHLVGVIEQLGDEPRTLPSTIPTGDGGRRRVELAAKRVSDDLVTVLVHDVEEQELTRDILQRALAHETETARRMRNLEELRTRFLSAVSHELRTPLTIILGAAESLHHHDERLSDEQRRGLMGRLYRNATRLHRLLDDLLDLNRLSAGRLPVHAEPHDVADLVTSALEEVDVESHDLRTRLTGCQVTVEARQIRRAIANLVRNAVVHTPQGTTIEVAAERVGDRARIQVIDHGAGVADPLKERIFDPFEQGPTVPSHQPGTGVGLALVREFVELHGGSVTVTDTPDGGATFVLELPASAP